jgi:hypothetical protein
MNKQNNCDTCKFKYDDKDDNPCYECIEIDGQFSLYESEDKEVDK